MIVPNWKVASHVKALMICKNDNEVKIRQLLPDTLFWLNQVHADQSIDIDSTDVDSIYSTQNLINDRYFINHIDNTLSEQQKGLYFSVDASFTTKRRLACVIKTADCLPVLLTNTEGTWISAIHAGWRGLASGVIEKTIDKYYKTFSSPLIAWCGPAICHDHFQVGSDVRDAFLKETNKFYSSDKDAFIVDSSQKHKWHADLHKLADNRLKFLDVDTIYHDYRCTFCDNQVFHSYRRDNTRAGRLASFIWLT